MLKLALTAVLGVALFGFFPLDSRATVAPSKEQLFSQSHLVVVGKILRIEAPANNRNMGRVTVSISNIEKGRWGSKTITFATPMTEEKGDLNSSEWTALTGKEYRFYLFNPKEDLRYKDSDLTDWILTDGWFGYERVN